MKTLKTTLMMAGLFGVAMALGRLWGGPAGLAVGFAAALALNAAAYWFSDRLALAMNGAREVYEPDAPALHAAVRRLSDRAGLPMPRVCIVPTDQPNAFAAGRDPWHAAIAVTEGLLHTLPADELEGVLAHEVSHIRNRDILICSIAATLAGAISLAAQVLHFRALFGGYGDRDRDGAGPFAVLVAIVIAPLAATIIQLAVSRGREYDADRGAAELTGRPMALAGALRRISASAERAPVEVNAAVSHMYIINPLGGEMLRGVAALFRTHPPTSERVARLAALARR